MEIPRAIRLVCACLFFSICIFIPAASTDTTVYGTGYKVWSGDLSDVVYEIAISDDGSVIAAGSRDGTVSLIDRSGKLLWAYNNINAGDFVPKSGYSGDKITSVAVTGDGESIAAGIMSGGESVRSPKVLLFRRDGTLVWTAEAFAITDVAVSQGGKRVVVSTERGPAVYDGSGSLLWDTGNLYSGNSVSVSDDGSVIAWTGNYNEVDIFNGAGNSLAETYLGQGRRWGMDNEYGEMSSDGAVLLVYQDGPRDGTFGLLAKDGKIFWSRTEPNSSANTAAITKDGNYAVAGMRNRVALYDRKGNELWTRAFNSSSSPVLDWSGDRNYIVDISRDGSVIAAAAEAGPIGLCSLSVLSRDGSVRWTIPVNEHIRKVALSADGQYLATTAESTLSLYRTTSGVTAPPAEADLKSGITYDTKSYVTEYVVPGVFTPANLVIGAIVLVILAVTVYGLLHFARRLKEKQVVEHMSHPAKYLITGIVVLIFSQVVNYLFAGLHYTHAFIVTGSLLNNLVLMCTTLLILGSILVIIGSAAALFAGYIQSRKK